MDISGAEWLDVIHAHYGRVMVTPVYVAAEITLGCTDPVEVASRINRRGRTVGDAVMASTTAADVVEAVEELTGFGFLVEVFTASCPHVGHDGCGCGEQVFELRLP